MSECPARCTTQLSPAETPEGVAVELCRSCKGMLLDSEALARLLGSELESVTEPRTAELALHPCLRCNTESWRARSVPQAEHAGAYACGACGMIWLLTGELERLRAHALALRRDAQRRARALPGARTADPTRVSLAPGLPAPGLEPAALDARALAAAGLPAPALSIPAPAAAASPSALPPQHPSAPGAAPDLEPFDRVSFEHGTANWLAAPVALLLALLFCGSMPGRFFGSLIAMPFHELGHALASWLSSRFAVPLPFFTVWHEEQSLAFGLLVAALIAAFGARSWHEERRFGAALALVLLGLQLTLSWLVSTRVSSMFQILGGALGEIALGALTLVAFHFPLPDRLRWDFWRWPALVPGSICLANAVLLWSRALRDTRNLPWGAAIGDESDGDMNRLVNVYGWRAKEIASLCFKAALLSVVALFAAQAWAWHRSRRLATSDRAKNDRARPKPERAAAD